MVSVGSSYLNTYKRPKIHVFYLSLFFAEDIAIIPFLIADGGQLGFILNGNTFFPDFYDLYKWTMTIIQIGYEKSQKPVFVI